MSFTIPKTGSSTVVRRSPPCKRPCALRAQALPQARREKCNAGLRLASGRRPLTACAAAASATETNPDTVGFVAEMRDLSMKLHTRDQSREGEQENKGKSFSELVPTREGYLQFLVESRVLFSTIEEIVRTNDAFSGFRDSGLERTKSLDTDIAFLESEFDMAAPTPAPDGPGETYSQLFRELADSEPHKFVCHFYNVYLAHTAGGRMIGKKVADTVLDRKFGQLTFYKYGSSLKPLVTNFKVTVNKVAENWTREMKDECLDETPKSFQNSGSIVRLIFEAQ